MKAIILTLACLITALIGHSAPPPEPAALAATQAALTATLAQPDLPPLFVRHLQSVNTLITTAWDEETARGTPARLEATKKDLVRIAAGLSADATDPAAYLQRGQRSLVLAFRNDTDGSLQHFTLRLPPRFDPKKTYPAVVHLHGMGPDHRTFYLAPHLAPFAGPPPLLDENDPLTQIIEIRPWGHGNQFYRDAAERDVWQSLEETRRIATLDADRIYLTGHSMGGFATWRIAGQDPRPWAALCILAGGMGPDESLAPQVAHLPVRLWHGDRDTAVPVESAHAAARALQRAGAREVDLAIVPGWDHTVPNKTHQKENLAWLLRHRRAAPPPPTL